MGGCFGWVAVVCASWLFCSQAIFSDENSTVGVGHESAAYTNEASASAAWSNASQTLLDLTAAAATLAQAGGYQYVSTTTRYGDSLASACGALDTASIVAGTGYYQVASAQAMQGGSCCWCGKASSADGHSTGTAPMGCFQCAKGRFTARKPSYALAASQEMSASEIELEAASGSGFASQEIHVVVADLCPHTGNEHWCPAQPGQTNAVGSKNHLDFSHPPSGIDNNYFVFTPTECSDELKARMRSQAKCV